VNEERRFGGSKEQTMSSSDQTRLDDIRAQDALTRSVGQRLEPLAERPPWWRRLFNGARNGLRT